MRKILFVVSIAAVLATSCTSNRPAVEDLSGLPPVSQQSPAPVVASTPLSTAPNSLPVGNAAPVATPITSVTTSTASTGSQIEQIDAYLTWFNDFAKRRMNWREETNKQVDQLGAGALFTHLKKEQSDYQYIAAEYQKRPVPQECTNLAQLYWKLMETSMLNDRDAINRINRSKTFGETAEESKLADIDQDNDDNAVKGIVSDLNKEIDRIYSTYPDLKTSKPSFSATN